MLVAGAAFLWRRSETVAPSHPPHDRAEAVRRVLKHLQRKTIAELEEGVAAVVVGRVRAIPAIAPIVSPVSGIRCLGYHVDARRLRFDSTYDLPQI